MAVRHAEISYRTAAMSLVFSLLEPRKISMKPVLLLIVCYLSLTANSFSQAAETFDISTFQAPKGWNKQAGENSIQFSTEDKGNFCLVTLFKAVPGLGNPKENFDAAWETIVKEAVTV